VFFVDSFIYFVYSLSIRWGFGYSCIWNCSRWLPNTKPWDFL